jgi:two-component system, cell cycle response regulator
LKTKASILVVDDDQSVLEYFDKLLGKEGYQVSSASDGRQALSMVRNQHPDLVLLDVIMPEMSGLEVCRILKARRDGRFLPIIILTSKGDTESRVEGLRLGADDYMTKPADPRELLARMEALLRIKELQDRIAGSLSEAEDKSVIDQLTGLYNERYLAKRLQDEFKRAERYSEPLSCIAVQLDQKEDPGGVDDEAIKQVAEILRGGIREFDIVVRSAPGRFVILLPRTHFTGSLSVATRIWQRLESKVFISAGHRLEINISIGVSFFPNKGVSSAKTLLDQADQAVSKAQAAGSNQICLFQHTTYFYRPDMKR